MRITNPNREQAARHRAELLVAACMAAHTAMVELSDILDDIGSTLTKDDVIDLAYALTFYGPPDTQGTSTALLDYDSGKKILLDASTIRTQLDNIIDRVGEVPSYYEEEL